MTPVQTTSIFAMTKHDFSKWLPKQNASIQAWVAENHFTAASGETCIIPDGHGRVAAVIAGIGEKPDMWSIAALPEKLPPSAYNLVTSQSRKMQEAMCLGWQLGSYQFGRYRKKKDKKLATLLPPKGCNTQFINTMAESIAFARDLINTPANDMGPAELAVAAKETAKKFGAKYHEIIGEDLLKHNYPAIYEVGKASARAPRLVDFTWGNPKHPKITLVGKGVCFDSGGLDIKSSSGMKLMKKDMGGAACILALAKLIMAHKLPVRLRVLIPAVENSIAGNAYRPSDVIATRKGISVEVGNTDAEGRLILCDALFEADQEKPTLLIDCATLTGAARIALGTDIPALFTPSPALGASLMQQGQKNYDPLWQLPLWEGYNEMLKSQVADINSAPDSSYAGAITAALFLKEFVQHTNEWAHIDMMAWNLSKRPGRPVGGEAMAVRSLYAYISERFGK